jgi:hypothetical protein
LAWSGYIKELPSVKGIPLLEVNLFDGADKWKDEVIRFLK